MKPATLKKGKYPRGNNDFTIKMMQQRTNFFGIEMCRNLPFKKRL